MSACPPPHPASSCHSPLTLYCTEEKTEEGDAQGHTAEQQPGQTWNPEKALEVV